MNNEQGMGYFDANGTNWNGLYHHRVRKDVTGVLYKYWPGMSWSDRCRIHHEAVVRMWERIGARGVVVASNKVIPWLVKTALRVALEEYRGTNRRNRNAMHAVDFGFVPDCRQSTADGMEQEDREAEERRREHRSLRLKREIGRLRPEHRVIIKGYAMRKPVRSIAAECGMTVGNVKTTKCRVLVQLQKALGVSATGTPKQHLPKR